MADILDLNNLIPEAVKIKIDEEELELQPPTLRTLMAINKLSLKASDEETPADMVDQIQNDLKAELVRICPGLDKHELNTNQLLALATKVAEMSQPQKGGEDSGVKPDPKATTP